MEVTSWTLQNGSYLKERTPWMLPSGTYTMEVTSWNLHHGSLLMDHTPWKLPHGSYIMEVTLSWVRVELPEHCGRDGLLLSCFYESWGLG